MTVEPRHVLMEFCGKAKPVALRWITDVGLERLEGRGRLQEPIRIPARADDLFHLRFQPRKFSGFSSGQFHTVFFCPDSQGSLGFNYIIVCSRSYGGISKFFLSYCRWQVRGLEPTSVGEYMNVADICAEQLCKPLRRKPEGKQ